MGFHNSQSSADLHHLQERLARLEMIVNDLGNRAGQAIQGVGMAWPSAGTGGGGGGTVVYLVKNTGGAIASGSSGTVSVVDEDGSTLTGDTMTAYLYLSGTWAVNKLGYVAMVGSTYEVISADC